jgi:hypothetical protein
MLYSQLAHLHIFVSTICSILLHFINRYLALSKHPILTWGSSNPLRNFLIDIQVLLPEPYVSHSPVQFPCQLKPFV